MSNYISDLGQVYVNAATSGSRTSTKTKDNTSLDMTDFLTLMVAQFQNQSMDNTADTSDMLNQLVQMTVVQAISQITDASVMSYAGSLVGKEVTVAQYDNQGKLQEIVGTVTGTGVSGGEQVIFVDGKAYALSDMLAVGRLPEVDKVEDAGKTEDSNNKTDETDKVDETDKSDNVNNTENPDQVNNANKAENTGSNTENKGNGNESSEVE